MPSKAASNAALKKFEERFSKDFGVGTLRRSSEVNPYEVIPSGSLTLDYRLGVGGYVEGRLGEIWGPDGIGKTTLCWLGIAEAQKKYPDKMTAFIDMEQKADDAWAAAHGVDLERNMLYTPESAEDVADALKSMLSSGLFSMVVVDSIGAMLPEKEKEKDADEATMALQAKIVTRMVKIAAVEARKTGTVVIFINQVRANLGYGADTTTGGGFALRHVTTWKLKMKRTQTEQFKVKIGDEQRIVGHEIAIQIERNGVAPAHRTAIVSLIHVPSEKYGPIGIDQVDEATTLGVTTGVIQQNGGWYTVPGGEKFNGREKVVEYLRTDPNMVRSIRQAVLASIAGEITEEQVPDADDLADNTTDGPEEKSSPKPNFRKGRSDA